VAELLKVNPAAPEPERIARAAALVRRGEVIAFPTDTLYGLAADPFNQGAVRHVFAIKDRPPDTPLLLLVDSVEMAERCAGRLPPLFNRLAARFWPGPLTLVVDASAQMPALVTANTGRVGLRLPAAAIPLALVRAVGGPVTATSANRSGMPACRSVADVQAALGDRLPLILDGGPSPRAQPSTVVGIRGSSWAMIREGAIPAAELASF
jgi:tRNA threonylcarbamoyl adenosine modification protein (Sua5/YciO/YrdC/YwlC family)